MNHKEIKDFGVKYSGAKKDLYTKLIVNDCSDLDFKKLEAEAKKIKKSDLWEKPNFAQDAMGFGKLDHSLIFLFIYDQLSSSPNLKFLKNNQTLNLTLEDCASAYKTIITYLRDLYLNRNYLKVADLFNDIRVFTQNQSNYDPELLINIGVKSKQSLAKFNYNKYCTIHSAIKYLGWGTQLEVTTNVYLSVDQLFNRYWTITENGLVICDDKNNVTYQFKTQSEAIVALKKHSELLYQRKQKERVYPKRLNKVRRPQPIHGFKRRGSDYRNGKNISVEMFCDVFKFKGVEWGNYINQVERQEFLNKAYDGFTDLMHLIGQNQSFASLNGNLGIAFGSRGSGKTMAHFDLDRNLMHFTRKGLGTVAHEFAHALDFWLAQQYPTIVENMLTEYDGYLEDCPINEPLNEWNNFIASSQFFKDAIYLDSTKKKRYWATSAELFARSFEHWVDVSLSNKGIENNFLVYGAKPSDSWEGLDTSAYPCGKESEKVCALITSIVDRLKFV